MHQISNLLLNPVEVTVAVKIAVSPNKVTF